MDVESVVATHNRITVVKRKVRVEEGYYLVKPLHVFVSSLENAIVEGVYTYKRPITLGSTGLVRILEAGANADPRLSGSLAIVSPISSGGVLGLELDGLLSTYTSIPGDTIVYTVDKDTPLYSIGYHALIVSSIRKLFTGRRALIVGGGIESLLLSLEIREYTSSLSVITRSRHAGKILRRYGVNTYRDPRDLKCCYDTVFYGLYTSALLWDIIRFLDKYVTIVVNPFIRTLSLPLTFLKEVRIVRASISKDATLDVLYKYRRLLQKNIRRIELSSLKEVVSLIPVNQPGYIVSLA